MHIGIAIRKVRKDLKLKQLDFSSKIGITQTYLSQIENGQKIPSANIFESIKEVFEIPTAILYWYSFDESDIKPNKVDAFRMLKPSMDTLIKEFYN